MNKQKLTWAIEVVESAIAELNAIEEQTTEQQIASQDLGELQGILEAELNPKNAVVKTASYSLKTAYQLMQEKENGNC